MKIINILLLLVFCCFNVQAQKRINGKLKITNCENSENLYDCSYQYLGTLFQEKLSKETIEYFSYYKEHPDTLELGVQFTVNEQGKAERKLMNTTFNSLRGANDTIYKILKENVSFIMPLNKCKKPVKQQTPKLLFKYKVKQSQDKIIGLELTPALSKEERKSKNTKSATDTYLSAAPKFCKKEESNKKRKACLSKFTKVHIAKNFGTKVIKKVGLNCAYRVYASIRIDKKGKVNQVIVSENRYKILEEEIIRVIKSLPKVTPGSKDRKPISILYTIPIVLQS